MRENKKKTRKEEEEGSGGSLGLKSVLSASLTYILCTGGEEHERRLPPRVQLERRSHSITVSRIRSGIGTHLSHRRTKLCPRCLPPRACRARTGARAHERTHSGPGKSGLTCSSPQSATQMLISWNSCLGPIIRFKKKKKEKSILTAAGVCCPRWSLGQSTDTHSTQDRIDQASTLSSNVRQIRDEDTTVSISEGVVFHVLVLHTLKALK